MTDPWFSAELAPYFAFLSLLALLAYLQPMAECGRNKTLVLGCYLGATAGALALLLLGAVAAVAGQPAHVTHTLVLSGGLTALLLAYYDYKMIRLYRDAEYHRTVAGDL